MTIRPNQIISYRWQSAKRHVHPSIVAKWERLADNAQGEVTVGSGEPQKRLLGTYTTESEARAAALSALKKSRQKSERIGVEVIFDAGRPAGAHFPPHASTLSKTA